MDQQDRRTPPRTSSKSNPHAATSGGSSSAMMLGLSSPATSPHRRRFSPSLYPAPAPLSPGRLASGSGSALRFGQIPIPPSSPGGRQRGTHALPTPFLSELASIRRMGASLFGDLDARPTSHRDAGATRRALHGHQQPQPQQQEWPSSTPTMSPLPSNRFSGFPASAFWPQQRRQVQCQSPSSSSGIPPPPALLQQQTTNHPSSSSTDLLAPLPSGTGIFSGLAPPPSPSSKSSFTDLTPLPGDELTTMFGSSSSLSSAHMAPGTVSQTMTMFSHAQSSSDSELLPFPPSLEMQPQDQQTPSWQWQSSGNYGVTCSEFEAPILDVAVAVAPRFQIKEEPMDAAPCIQLQPELISLDDEDDDGLSALLQSFQSPSEPASFHSLEPTSLLEDSSRLLQLGGSGSRLDLSSSDGPSVWSTADTSGEDWAGIPALAGMFHQMSIGGGTMSTGQGWPATPAAPEGGQYCMFDDNSGSSTWPVMPSCASMFDQVTIGGGSMSGMGQGWPETPAAADDAGVCVFDNSGSSTNPWPEMPSFATSMLDQVTIGGGSMSQGWPETPAPAAAAASNYAMFDIDITAGGSSSSSSGAWASKPWNISSSSMENSTPVPKLILGGMEKSRLPRQLPSRAAVASSSMSRRGTYGDLFSAAEMEIINRDKRLKEIVNTDPKRVKKYVYL
ncbi:hypothetical protein PVAP13_2NG197700 [Panicum virgatum]|uniref:Uncharacterized protein n=1 Tax=Panicum virgatum TaxID=38727 RepID=A0A8T0VIN1_PANVG|nr:hypothetical protein PVAP13_2NG197700 [Panicum virgatum]